MPAIDGFAAAAALPLGWLHAASLAHSSVLIQSTLALALCSLPPLDALGFAASLSYLSAVVRRQPAPAFPTVVDGATSNRQSCISVWRSLATLASCWCILAVDTPLFPPSLRKCSGIGCLGFMDSGSGAFVLFNAVAGSRGSRRVSCASSPSSSCAASTSQVSSSLKRPSRAWGKPLCMAIGRLVATSASGYSVPDEEYGRHWNFFFTLSFALHISKIMRRNIGTAAGSALVLSAHQAALLIKKGALTEWALSDERDRDLISLNKEGIVSLSGYVGLHLLGCMIAKKLSSAKTQRQFICYALLCSMLSWSAFVTLSELVQPPSRRIANCAYIAWVTSINCAAMAASMYACMAAPASPVRGPVKAVDENMLPVFLLGNLLTGGLNMVVDLAELSRLQSLVLLVLYMSAVVSFALVLHSYQVKL